MEHLTTPASTTANINHTDNAHLLRHDSATSPRSDQVPRQLSVNALPALDDSIRSILPVTTPELRPNNTPPQRADMGNTQTLSFDNAQLLASDNAHTINHDAAHPLLTNTVQQVNLDTPGVMHTDAVPPLRDEHRQPPHE